LLAFVASADAQDSPKHAEKTIEAKATIAWDPAALTVAVGDVIEWKLGAGIHGVRITNWAAVKDNVEVVNVAGQQPFNAATGKNDDSTDTAGKVLLRLKIKAVPAAPAEITYNCIVHGADMKGKVTIGRKSDLIEMELLRVADGFLKDKLASAEQVTADTAAIAKILDTPEFRAFIETHRASTEIATDNDLGKAVAHAWERIRRLKKQKFENPVTFADVSDEIKKLVRVRFESVPPQAEIFIDKKSRGKTPLILFLASDGIYQIEAKAEGYMDHSDSKYTPPLKGELKKIKLEKKQ
jgi:plastocyanin